MVCPTGGAADATIAVTIVIRVKYMIITVRDRHRLLKRLVLYMGILLFLVPKLPVCAQSSAVVGLDRRSGGRSGGSLQHSPLPAI
jgi:hypothetical protein